MYLLKNLKLKLNFFSDLYNNIEEINKYISKFNLS